MPQDVKKNNNLSISNLDPDWKPPTSGAIDDTWTPPDQVKKEPESDMLGSLSKHIFEAPEFVKSGAKSISDFVTKPELSDQSNPVMPYLKGALGGMTEGAASLLSPANIAQIVFPEVGAINKGLGAFQGVSGANKLIHGDFSGLGDIGFGMLGIFGGGKKGSKTEIIPPTELSPAVGHPSSMEGSILDEAGNVIAPPQPTSSPRPDGPWNANTGGDTKKKSIEELQFELARDKFNMGRDLPSDSPRKPMIKDYWITDAKGNKKLNPKYQPIPQDKGVSAVFKGWQEDGDGGHIALYDIKGGPLDRSTVSEASLKAAGIDIPQTPKFDKNAANPAREAAIKRQKNRIDITEGFGGSGHPESSEYVGKVLKAAGTGKPGLSINDTHVTYRDKSGNPIATAKIVKDKDGKLLIQDLAADKSKGLLTGRAVAAISSKLKEMKATESSGTTSKDATNLLERMSNRVNREIESPTLKNLFSGETGAVRFGPNKQKPINASTKSLRQPSDEVVDKLINAIADAGPKRAIQDDLYSIERAKRINAAENVTEKGLPGLYKQLHELKGELPKVDFERTKMKQSEVNDLINYVTNSPHLLPFEKIRAKIGLLKMLSSKREEVPQRGELALLSEVFGKKFDDVVQMHGGLGGEVSMKIANEFANLSKSVMASIDMSAPLRQGLPLIHKKEWWTSIKPMVESFASQERFDGLMASIKDRPGYLFGKKMGLKFTDVHNNKEELFASVIANNFPGVKMSERAYVGFLNKLRADTFDGLMADAVTLGHDPAEIGPAIAKFVNNATGRGNIGKADKFGRTFLDRNAAELNVAFFSPRLIASRLNIVNPKTYLDPSIPKFVRLESLKSLMAIATFSVAAKGLTSVMGGSTNLNPTSSDFMKGKFGNTRMDPNGGVQQYIVAATRFITGQTTSSTSNQTREIGKKYGSPSRVSMMVGVGDKYNRSFMENKFSPLVGLADDILAKRNPEQNGLGGIISHANPNDKNPSVFKGSYNADIINRFVPLMVNDMIDLYKDDPNAFVSGKALLGAGAFTGMGMQTYKSTVKKDQLRISVR